MAGTVVRSVRLGEHGGIVVAGMLQARAAGMAQAQAAATANEAMIRYKVIEKRPWVLW